MVLRNVHEADNTTRREVYIIIGTLFINLGENDDYIREAEGYEIPSATGKTIVQPMLGPGFECSCWKKQLIEMGVRGRKQSHTVMP